MSADRSLLKDCLHLLLLQLNLEMMSSRKQEQRSGPQLAQFGKSPRTLLPDAWPRTLLPLPGKILHWVLQSSIAWLVDTWGGILTLLTGVYSVYGKGWLKMYADELSLSTSHVSSILLSLRDNMDVTTIYFLLLLWYFHAGSFYFLKTVAKLFFPLDYTSDI